MDLSVHHIVHGIIHESMSHDEPHTFEKGGNYSQPIVSAAAGRARMARMQRRLVDELEFDGRQGCRQLCADALDARAHAWVSSGASCTYFDKYSVCSTMNTTKMAGWPKALKVA